MNKKLLFILFMAAALFSNAQVGQLDNGFNNNGYVVTNLTHDFAKAQQVLLQKDGKIVVLGFCRGKLSGKYDVALMRYNTDGTLDETFNSTGFTTVDIFGFNDYAYSGIILENGKILVNGYAQTASNYDVLLMRFNSDGSLDNTFGENGKGYITNDFSNIDNNSEAIAVQADGKIVIGGFTENKFAFYRYNENGTLDATFGNAGIAIVSVGNLDSYIKSIAIQNDGKIVAAGFASNGIDTDIAIVRLNENGVLDNSFNSNGVVFQPIGDGHDFLNSLLIQPDGKIVVGGHKWISNIPELQYDFAILRYNQNGSLDNTFGNNGVAIVHLVEGSNYLFEIALQENGSIVAVGHTVSNNKYCAAITRIDNKGALDMSFGNNGFTLSDLLNYESYYTSVAINHKNGKIYSTGYALYNNDYFVFTTACYKGKADDAVNEINDDFCSAFPNPANDFIFIESKTGNSVKHYEIIDVTGKTIENQALNDNKININTLRKGLYFIKLTNNNGDQIIKKIIKK